MLSQPFAAPLVTVGAPLRHPSTVARADRTLSAPVGGPVRKSAVHTRSVRFPQRLSTVWRTYTIVTPRNPHRGPPRTAATPHGPASADYQAILPGIRRSRSGVLRERGLRGADSHIDERIVSPAVDNFSHNGWRNPVSAACPVDTCGQPRIRTGDPLQGLRATGRRPRGRAHTHFSSRKSAAPSGPRGSARGHGRCRRSPCPWGCTGTTS